MHLHADFMPLEPFKLLFEVHVPVPRQTFWEEV